MVEENVTVIPTLVYWKIGEPDAAKSVRVTARKGPLSIKGIVSANPEWHAEVETIKPGEDYVVRIKPPATTARSGTEFKIVTELPADQPRSHAVHGRVK